MSGVPVVFSILVLPQDTGGHLLVGTTKIAIAERGDCREIFFSRQARRGGRRGMWGGADQLIYVEVRPSSMASSSHSRELLSDEVDVSEWCSVTDALRVIVAPTYGTKCFKLSSRGPQYACSEHHLS